MKIGKLLENIAKGKLENYTKIKVDNGVEIVYRCDDENSKYYFEDEAGKKIEFFSFFFVILNRL